MDPATWLLDVDGVINGSGRTGWHAAPHTARVTVGHGDECREFRLRWAPQLINAIHRIHTAGTARIVWCTTWCPEVDILERLWGLTGLPRAWTDHLYGYKATEAKRAAARQVIADGGRLIWTDDDAFPARGWPERELLADGRALLIKPHENRGLRPHHLDLITSFVNGEPGPATVIHATAKE